jgi:hypothetical protein
MYFKVKLSAIHYLPNTDSTLDKNPIMPNSLSLGQTLDTNFSLEESENYVSQPLQKTFFVVQVLFLHVLVTIFHYLLVPIKETMFPGLPRFTKISYIVLQSIFRKKIRGSAFCK